MPRPTETLGAPAVNQEAEMEQIFAKSRVDFHGSVEGVSGERAIEADHLIRAIGALGSLFEAPVILKMVEDDGVSPLPDIRKVKPSQSPKAV